MMKQVRAGYSKMKTQQNRLDDGVHVDFGNGVGGLFNSPTGARKIQRKSGLPTSDTYTDENPTSETTGADSNHRPSTPKVEQNPVRIPGMKRGGR